jgi:hypothetical protein
MIRPYRYVMLYRAPPARLRPYVYVTVYKGRWALVRLASSLR